MKATFLHVPEDHFQKAYWHFSDSAGCIPEILHPGKVLIIANAFRTIFLEQHMRNIQRYFFLIRFIIGIELMNAVSPKVRRFFIRRLMNFNRPREPCKRLSKRKEVMPLIV